ncbi:ABC transporter permease [Nocardioides sp. NPDC051685]|uniref:ABC transporter permease n=1 Tax=Nocardioides sp. NPDC051685 TaxID=3364334 RepID=UPI0037A024FA
MTSATREVKVQPATARSPRTMSWWLLPWVTVLAAVLLAQVVTSNGLFRPDQFPTPFATFQAFADALTTSTMWSAVSATLQTWSVGLFIATALALVVGALLASNDFAFRSASPVIEIFKAIPAIAILPLVILVLGSTPPMKVFLVAFGVFWPLLIQVIYGMRSVDPTVLDTAKVSRVRGVRKFLVVTVPSAAPYIATGLRIASANALILAVVSELVGGAEGIGRIILQSQSAGASAYPRMYAYVLISGLLGLLLTGAFFLIEKKALHWHESQRNLALNERSSQ